MKNIFKEYHQYSDDEFKKLWKSCIFVFDTNTLLNMYRYSRETVQAYISVLKELKANQQIWIPYQVGFEFYENRIDVICEYEKSYDDILSVLLNTKVDIEKKYKDHPFLDISEINEEIKKGLSGVEAKITQAKKQHPKWLDKDEVLESIHDLFDNSVGNPYDNTKIESIYSEGKKRYEKKIPPGYKDDKKPDNKKFGDLILWYQIIGKAIETKKPIILISGDVKEDWWLVKEGKRIMSLPQLKKEMYEKANVDFHIYTADRFLELYKSGAKSIDEKTIREVRKIRELEEKRLIRRRADINKHEEIGYFEIISSEFFHYINSISDLIRSIPSIGKYSEEINFIFMDLKRIRNGFQHNDFDKQFIHIIDRDIKEINFIVERILQNYEIDHRARLKLQDLLEKINYFTHKLKNQI